MIIKPEEIQNIIDGMEHNIQANTEYIELLSVFKAISLAFDNKVFNKRFVDAINAQLPLIYSFCSHSFNQYGQSHQFTIYQRDRFSDNYSKTYTFKLADCFEATDSGKHRIKAAAFVEACQQMRQEIIAENIRIRAEIDTVYQMLADAQALYNQAQTFEKKYSYSLKEKFRCNYHLRTY